MPALNFQDRFAPDVESGIKTQTIRAFRRDGNDPGAGDTLYLYTGMRTKACRRLGETVCERARRIYMAMDRVAIMNEDGGGDLLTDHDALCAFAAADGFRGIMRPWLDMRCWFEQAHKSRGAYGLSFWGLLIEWGDLI